MKTRLARFLILAAAFLFAVNGAWAGAIPKYGHYRGTIRVTKTWPDVGTTRSAEGVIAIFQPGMFPGTQEVMLQYRPSTRIKYFWTENLWELVAMTVASDGSGTATSMDDYATFINGVVIGHRDSMIIKLSRATEGSHPAVQIIINLSWEKPL